MGTKSVSVPPVEGGTVQAAGLSFPDLLGTADALFDRYVKFKTYQDGSRDVEEARDILRQIEQQQNTAPPAQTGSGLSGSTVLIVGGLTLLAVVLLVK